MSSGANALVDDGTTVVTPINIGRQARDRTPGKPRHRYEQPPRRPLVLKEKQIMQTQPVQNTSLFVASRRWALGLLLAVLVALSAVYTPVALQELAGVNTTATAYACGPHSGGGGC